MSKDFVDEAAKPAMGFPDIDYTEIRDKIRKNGGIVDEAEIPNNPV